MFLKIEEKKANNFLLESGIKLPKNTKAIKLTGHEDADGFFSILFAYHQLIKQGIKPENIKIDFIQYGNSEESMKKKFKTHNKQASVLVDFSAIPKENLLDKMNQMTNYSYKEKDLQNKFLDYVKELKKNNFKNKTEFLLFTKKFFSVDPLKINSKDEDLEKFYELYKNFDYKKIDTAVFNKKDYNIPIAIPDFVSDHHYNYNDNLTKGKYGAIKNEFKSDSEHIAISFAPNIADYATIKSVTQIDSADFDRLEDNFELPKNFKEKGRMLRLAIITKTLLESIMKNNKELAIYILKKSSPSIVSVYNNIIKYRKYNTMQIKIFKEIISEKPNWNLIDILRSELPQELKEKTSKEDLIKIKPLKTREDWIKYAEDNLIKTKTGYLTKKDEEQIANTYEKKVSELRKIQKNLYEKQDKINSLLKQLEEKYTKEINTTYKKEISQEIKKTKKELKTIEEKIRKIFKITSTFKKDYEKKLDEKQGQFTPIGSKIMRQDVKSYQNMPSRYLGSALVSNGERKPFFIRRFSGMIQVSGNPDLSKELKEKLDLTPICQKVLKEARNKYETFSNKWAFEKITDSSGGHKGIFTFSNLNMLGLMNKKDRDKLKQLEEYETRARKAGISLEKIAKKHPESIQHSNWAILNKLREQKAQIAQLRIKIMNEIELGLYKELSKLTDFKVDKPSGNPEKYKYD